MNVNSLVVRARLEHTDRIRAEMNALPGVEVHACDGAGRMIVIVEDSTNRSAAETILDVHRIDGVLAASLVYQFNDDEIVAPEPREATDSPSQSSQGSHAS